MRSSLPEVAFTWPSTRVTKRRGVGGKKIHWFPPGDPTPPFWPEPPLHLRERIFITEGESDCGILRYCGHEAYALTKGANGVPARSIWEEMVLRGAKSFVLCLDLDTAGHEGSRKIQKVLQGLPGVTIEIFDPPKLPNPFIGATDLRDLFLQLGSVDAFNEFFSTALQGLGGTLISKTLDERLQEESSEPAWLWENYLAPASMTLIAGAPKVGKSTLLFALFSSFREGGVLLNARTRPCKVMFLTEERPGTLWDKRAQWGTMGHVSVVMRHEVMDQEWPALIERAAIEAQFLGCQVLVVDTLSEWAKIEDENDASLVNEALRCIQESCIPRNLGVFLVHHMRKSQGEHGSGIRGSSAFAASVEVILEYYRESGSRRRLEVISRFSGEFEPQMIGMERGRIFLADNLGNSRESREKAVLDTMSGGPKTPKEIADELGLSSESVRIWLGQLVRSGRVVTTGQGRRGDPRKFSLPTETNDHEDQDGD